MKSKYFPVLSLLLIVWMSSVAFADLAYFNDFEAYTVPSAINGIDGWSSDAPAEGGLQGWRVLNPNYANPGAFTGNFLLHGNAFSQYGQDYATLHLFDESPIGYLRVSMNYLLQGNELGSVEISGNNSNWIDVTGELGITPRFSNDITWYATADLSSLLETAGIQNDIYIRFMDWNPTQNDRWHWFAIDNLQVTTPEPATIILLGLGGLMLRNRRIER